MDNSFVILGLQMRNRSLLMVFPIPVSHRSLLVENEGEPQGERRSVSLALLREVVLVALISSSSTPCWLP